LDQSTSALEGQPSTAAAQAKDPAARMPKDIPFIVVNEFAERFCFYGINSMLALFLVQFLHFGEAQATTWGSLFKSGAYFFPLLGAIASDVFWGKFRTVVSFSIVYVIGCVVLAASHTAQMLAIGLFLVAFGTGGIKPCVATNVGDQFTTANQHLIERAFSWFYLAINAGSTISILLCPILLSKYGAGVAFGTPAAMMLLATIVFWAGRRRFAVVPPAGRVWLKEVFGPVGLKTIANLLVIYLFIAFFWSLWDQSNGTSWSLQARSSLMDKDLGFGITLLPAQIQAVNAVFILLFAPFFSYVVYPLWGKLFKVTPVRKIAIGLFVTASSFLVIAWIESRIQSGHGVSIWWQILAYAILTCGEVLVSITGLEFSYTQAPLSMKSFIMALFYLAVSIGNLFTAAVNHYMVRPLQATSMEVGSETWLHLTNASAIISGQKIDFDGATGVYVVSNNSPGSANAGTSTANGNGNGDPLAGTFIVGSVYGQGGRVSLLNVEDRKPLMTRGAFDAQHASVSTYALVGPAYFMFFAKLMAAGALLFIVVAYFYREKTYVRSDTAAASS
jgi:proton-dependent oligopeptide transporter, POT family